MTIEVNTRGWRNVAIRDLPLQIIDGDRSARYPKRSEFQDSGVLFLNTTNIVDDRLDLGEAVFVSQEKFSEIQKGRVQRGDVLMTTRGSIGKVALFNADYETALINAQMLILRADQTRLDSRFLFYSLRSPYFKQCVANFASGSAQPQIPITDLRDVELSVPPFPVQRRIAGILSAYDELIENNQRRIRILEEMARALYREWFVNFRFPGHEKIPLVDSPLGPLPNGWEAKLVKDILSRRAAGTVYREADVKPEGATPVLDQSTNELLGFHDNEPDHLASPATPMAIFGDHTCKMQLLIEPFSVGPNVVPFAAGRELPTAYVYYGVNSLVQTQEYKRHWIPLNAKEIVVADRVTAQRFASLIQPMLVAQETLRKAIRNLRRTRDMLLPRLLSGQLNPTTN